MRLIVFFPSAEYVSQLESSAPATTAFPERAVLIGHKSCPFLIPSSPDKSHHVVMIAVSSQSERFSSTEGML